MRDLALPLSILVLAAAILWVGMSDAVATEADAPHSPGMICKEFQNMHGNGKREEWADEQLTAGRRQFVAMPHAGGGTWLCSW